MACTTGTRCTTRPIGAAFCALALLTACTPLRPDVTLERGVSLRNYHVVVVGPVTDRSGYPFPYGVADSLRARLTERLRDGGVTVLPTTTDTTVPILFVVSSLDGFKNAALTMQLPSAGTSRCVFSSRLLDGHSGRRLGEMVSSEVTSDDTQQLSPAALLTTCARMTADELVRRMKS